jgi:hypothetical protein
LGHRLTQKTTITDTKDNLTSISNGVNILPRKTGKRDVREQDHGKYALGLILTVVDSPRVLDRCSLRPLADPTQFSGSLLFSLE